MKRLFNYRTKEYDERIGWPDDFRDYIPQDEHHQTLYWLYTTFQKLSPLRAAGRIWKLMLGIKENDNNA